MPQAQVLVYTKDYCPFCDQAKLLLQKLGISYEEINLENEPKLRLQLSEENNGWRTVPMIFINKKFIGGFTDLKALVDQNKLDSLLKK